jgi:hypothetical protein
VPLSSFATGSIYQNTAHCLARGMKELSATAEGGVLISDQSYPRFVNQRGRLKRLTGKLPLEFGGRTAPQFCI